MTFLKYKKGSQNEPASWRAKYAWIFDVCLILILVIELSSANAVPSLLSQFLNSDNEEYMEVKPINKLLFAAHMLPWMPNDLRSIYASVGLESSYEQLKGSDEREVRFYQFVKTTWKPQDDHMKTETSQGKIVLEGHDLVYAKGENSFQSLGYYKDPNYNYYIVGNIELEELKKIMIEFIKGGIK